MHLHLSPIGSDALRISPEVYANSYDHSMLFSDVCADGKEILTLPLAKGNVNKWDVQNKVLWLETIDKRAEVESQGTYIWSLDISALYK